MRFISQKSKNLIKQYARKNVKRPQKFANTFINIASMNNNEKIQFSQQDNALFTTIYDYEIYLDVLDEQIDKIIKVNKQDQQITDIDQIQKILKIL